MSLNVPPYFPVTIASLAQQCAAWVLLNPQDLLQAAPDHGENPKEAGVDGRVGEEHGFDQQTVDLRYIFTGQADVFGDPIEDPIVGLALNKRGFTNSVYREATRDAEWSVECTVEDVDGTMYSGRVQTHAPRFSEGLTECTCVMQVTILRGELTPEGS